MICLNSVICIRENSLAYKNSFSFITREGSQKEEYGKRVQLHHRRIKEALWKILTNAIPVTLRRESNNHAWSKWPHRTFYDIQ